MSWEYKTVGLYASREDHLNELGAQGWELMFMDQGLAYFKRQKGPAINTAAPNFFQEIPNHPMRERLKVERLKIKQ